MRQSAVNMTTCAEWDLLAALGLAVALLTSMAEMALATSWVKCLEAAVDVVAHRVWVHNAAVTLKPH
jgi:hypothetical protein